MLLIKITIFVLFSTLLHGEEKIKEPNLGYADIKKLKAGAEPFLEVWDEDNVYGVLDVAMDGTVLMSALKELILSQKTLLVLGLQIIGSCCHPEIIII